MKTITRKGKRYIEKVVDRPISGQACNGCDLYAISEDHTYGKTRCGKGSRRKPSCIAALRPDNKWVVFKEVRK